MRKKPTYPRQGTTSIMEETGHTFSEAEDNTFILTIDYGNSEKPHSYSKSGDNQPSKENFNNANYANGRIMSPVQERWNAITILPSAFYCLYFILSGRWEDYDKFDGGETLLHANEGCIRSAFFPNLHALPPLPVLFISAGIILHCPCSFLYHWRYAVILPPGLARVEHWSRKLDQAAIHFCSALWSYGMSGSRNYFMLNMLYNADCIFRLLGKEVRPRRNQVRILLSMLAYTAPIIWQGDTTLFIYVWSIFSISLWLFATYPIGGWSHAAFHVFMAFVPPLLFDVACRLPASQDQILMAARCAQLSEE